MTLGGGQAISPIEGRRKGQREGKIAFTGLRTTKCFSMQEPELWYHMSKVSISVTGLSEGWKLCFLAVHGKWYIPDLLQRVTGWCTGSPAKGLSFDIPGLSSPHVPLGHWRGGNFLTLMLKTEQSLLGHLTLLSCLFSWAILTAVSEGRIISHALLEHLIGSVHASLHLISPL